MLVLIIILVPITKARATTYTADDSVVIQSNYHDLFNNYFSGKNSYLYFPYSCESSGYNRTCYFGIDSENNYLKVDYVNNGYNNYTTRITTGVDENFKVNGINVIRKEVNPDYVILVGIVFIFLFYLIIRLIRFD